MRRTITLIAAGALALCFCLAGHAQDSQSLGDVARQSQKDKAAKPAVAKVFTNDDLTAGSSVTTTTGGAHPGEKGASANTGGPGGIQSPADGLEKLQSALDQLASLDRASLSVVVLEGNGTNFPGRAAWEEELFAAKQTFVAQSRLTLQKARQIAASAEGIRGSTDPNDPRVKSLGAKLDQLVQEAQRNGAAFQTVVAEGKSLASKSTGQ